MRAATPLYHPTFLRHSYSMVKNPSTKLSLPTSHVNDLSTAKRYSMDIGAYINWFVVDVRHAFPTLLPEYDQTPADTTLPICIDKVGLVHSLLGRDHQNATRTTGFNINTYLRSDLRLSLNMPRKR